MKDVLGGLDVGGTKIAFGLVKGETGERLFRDELPSGKANGDLAVLQQIRKAGQALELEAKNQKLNLVGIGVGLPELVTISGDIASQWNFKITRSAVLQALNTTLPVELDSDVRCSARAELVFGIGLEYANFSYISIGTGISCTQVIEREILEGARGFAIHFGSSPLVSIDSEGREEKFCLEEFASGAGLAAQWRNHNPPLTAQNLVEGLGGDDGITLICKSQRAMASYLGQMVNLLDPAAMVIGGGLGRSHPYFEKVVAMVPEFIWAEGAKNIKIFRESFDGDAGIVGAAIRIAPRN